MAEIHFSRIRFALLLVAALGMLVVTVRDVQAQTLISLHSFAGGKNDGAYPQAGLVRDNQGNLYGTTVWGGALNCGGRGCGTAYKLTPDGQETVIFHFKKSNSNPSAVVLDASGNPYGTTESGSLGGKPTYGSVFELEKSKKGTKLKMVVLDTFSDLSEGELPHGGLVMDAQGSLYGTTYYGGSGKGPGYGTVFKVTSGTETVLYSFAGGRDGAIPGGGLIFDGSGNLYGTTTEGGGHGCGGTGCGTVFKLTPDGSETVLYRFSGGSDGAEPVAGLVLDAAGNLYGTTELGGAACAAEEGCGTVFRLAPDGTETLLYRFGIGSDGSYPVAGLVLDAQGNLYGTTNSGGGSSCPGAGCGTVFKLTPDGSETILYRFTGGTDGAYPQAPLVMDPQGNLYGTTTGGGGTGQGTVFEITP